MLRSSAIRAAGRLGGRLGQRSRGRFDRIECRRAGLAGRIGAAGNGRGSAIGTCPGGIGM
jgi:hypothetical protein